MESLSDNWMVLFRTLGSLALVLLAIFAFAQIAKRVLNSKFGHSGPLGSLRIRQMLPFGNRSRVVLLELENRRILLGITPHQITRLDHWEEQSSDSTLSESKEQEVSHASVSR